MTAHRRPESKTLAKYHTEVAGIVGECICGPAWTERGLAQHDCAWCDHAEEVAKLFSGLAALRKAANGAMEMLEEAARAFKHGSAIEQDCMYWCNELREELKKKGE